MPNRLSNLLRCTALAVALALAACGADQDAGNLASLDNSLVGNDADPALTSALQDQIAVDPNLVNQSNRNAVRPPETPTQAQYPAGHAAAGGRAQAGGGTLRAPSRLPATVEASRSARRRRDWQRRLPRRHRPVRLQSRAGPAGCPPPSRSIRAAGSAEAAGNNQGDCRIARGHLHHRRRAAARARFLS